MDITTTNAYSAQYLVSNSFEQRSQSRGENLTDQQRLVFEMQNRHAHGDRVTVSDGARNMSRQRQEQSSQK